MKLLSFLIIPIAVLASPAYASADWYEVKFGEKTAAAGCVPIKGNTSMTKDVAAILSRDMANWKMDDAAQDGEPQVRVSGRTKTGDFVDLYASSRIGCMLLLAKNEAAQNFEHWEMRERGPKVRQRIEDNLAQLLSGKEIKPFPGKAAMKEPGQPEAQASGQKEAARYVSNASGNVALLYDGDCTQGPGKNAQAIRNEPPMVMGCWQRVGNKIHIEWQSYITRNGIGELPRGRYTDVFDDRPI